MVQRISARNVRVNITILNGGTNNHRAKWACDLQILNGTRNRASNVRVNLQSIIAQNERVTYKVMLRSEMLKTMNQWKGGLNTKQKHKHEENDTSVCYNFKNFWGLKIRNFEIFSHDNQRSKFAIFDIVKVKKTSIYINTKKWGSKTM